MVLLAAVLAAGAQVKQSVKQVPPSGIEIAPAARAELQAGLDHLRGEIRKLKGNPLLPDVEIYSEAVRWALQYGEFFKPDEVAKARLLLEHGESRAAQLEEGKAPWTTAAGLVVRGYVSKIDGSVQPYGLVVPPSYSPDAPRRWRLDAWFHGRKETLSQLNFLADREKNVGEFAPRDTIVLHLYGRFCNASKFAGETDLFEALDAVKRNYAIDENRILVRGFSMGGASAWHIGAHYAGLWAAVAPGAGFSETMQYLKLPASGPGSPPEWERKLYHLYDATDYALNLYNTATVAYNGELDPQKQAADMMERAMAAEGLRLLRIVGPGTQHKYEPQSKVEIERILDAVAERGRDPYPRTVRLVTWTLKYNRMKWLTVDALGAHWDRARVDAELTGDSGVTLTTSNVTALTLEFGAGGCPLDLARNVALAIDEQKVSAPGPMSDRSWTVHLRKNGGRWAVSDEAGFAGLRKRHGLQGPIDDAFMDSFIFVRPTGTPISPELADWVGNEEARALFRWQRQFRGDARIKWDRDITDADIASSNLVLWGDPGSNAVLSRIIGRLPVKWDAAGVAIEGRNFTGTGVVPVLIYPNPLNPKKYVVINSGFTFREATNTSNARQTPKLPDWAVLDTSVGPNAQYGGKVLAAGFFDEEWK